ncbi:MAG: hypothetical protein HQL82_14310 [Magnetococcales bacterium]|nr:hypothetical protein [Magnetococcales bacterium]
MDEQSKTKAVGELARAGMEATIRTVLEEIPRITKLETLELAKVAEVIKAASSAKNFCCSGVG